jgi:DNA-directed RNA polymerase subunit beta
MERQSFHGDAVAVSITFEDFFTFAPVTAALREFFVASPLSQFADQTNSLADLAHKRRVTFLGPGGIGSERGGLALRDIHPTQAGRLCVLDTSHGPRAGLTGSLALYARVNSYGFLEAPFHRVRDGKVLQEDYPVFLTSEAEDQSLVSNGYVAIDPKGNIKNTVVSAHFAGELISVSRDNLEYIAVAPVQILSVGGALVPFLEHDDATRVFMASNMQRQAVPLLYPEAPLVGTGLELQAARESCTTVVSVAYGKTINVSSQKILIKDRNGDTFAHILTKYRRSNQGTPISQRPSVSIGEKVVLGQVLADDSSTEGGELSLGQNILIAYMPWFGYNFEDGIVISERLIDEDVFTSLHIERLKVHIRENKWGMEEITRDVPDGGYLLRNLDQNGIVKIGAWVNAQDILVGKLTPTPPSVLGEALLKVVYGDSLPRNVEDTSLTVPSGMSGRVVDVDVFHSDENQILESVKVYVAYLQKVQVGDKLAGRHGNKGIITKVVPREDMPFLPEGAPVDMVLNPLGVPSRMNIGQLFEGLLGFAAHVLQRRFKVPPFDERYGAEASRALVLKNLKEAGELGPDWLSSLSHPGKVKLREGGTGQLLDHPVTVANAYFFKLVHIVDEKIHARSTGGYSRITRQPVGGRSRGGGQRFGEMEVWALEAFGAAYTLQELLTIKSDDVQGRNAAFSAIVKDEVLPSPGIPESFRVLMRELQSLCLDVGTYKVNFDVDPKLGNEELTDYEVDVVSGLESPY